MWPVARIKEAPSGNTSAHNGHVRFKPFGFHDATAAPTTTAAVPMAIGTDMRSPRMRMAKTAPKIGVMAVSELVSVGPIILMLEMASHVDSAGRMSPTMANITAAVVNQYQPLRKNGANSQ